MANFLSLKIHQVECIDEIGNSVQEWFGNDEIYLGGLASTPGNEPSKISFFDVYPHFDDGDKKHFNPPHTFATFDLSNSIAPYPRLYGVGFLLAEKQHGGMDDTLDEIYDKVAEALGGLAAVAAISLTGLPWAGPVAAVVVTHSIKQASDKMFEIKNVEFLLPSANHEWSGSNKSPLDEVAFSGHNGEYKLTYSWELV